MFASLTPVYKDGFMPSARRAGGQVHQQEPSPGRGPCFQSPPHGWLLWQCCCILSTFPWCSVQGGPGGLPNASVVWGGAKIGSDPWLKEEPPVLGISACPQGKDDPRAACQGDLAVAGCASGKWKCYFKHRLNNCPGVIFSLSQFTAEVSLKGLYGSLKIGGEWSETSQFLPKMS